MTLMRAVPFQVSMRAPTELPSRGFARFSPRDFRRQLHFKTVYFRADSVLNVKHEQANSVMDYDLGHFDLKTRVLEPLENPRGAKVLPMS
jgi:hypothetical protein